MHRAETKQSQNDFRNELINRLFHTQSYFFRCLNRKLEAVLGETSVSDRTESLLLANLFDKLVMSEEKSQLVAELAKIEDFQAFLQTLEKGILFLKNTRLHPEQLKSEIEQLAQALFDAGMVAVRGEGAKHGVNRILGDLNIDRDQAPDESANFVSEFTVDEKAAASHAHESEYEFVLSEPNDDSISSKERTEQANENVGPFSDEYDDSIPELNVESEVDIADVSSGKTDFPKSDRVGKEAADDGGCDYDSSEENGSTKSNRRNKPEAMVTGQPASLNDAFETNARSQLLRLRDYLKELQASSRDRRRWQACMRVMEELASSAMIIGFEPFEQIALKIEDFIASVVADDSAGTRYACARLQEAQEVLASSLNQPADQVDAATFEELAAKLSAPIPSNGHHAVAPEQPPSGSSDRVDATKKNADPQNKDDTLALAEQGSHFKIPGEDDDEIVKLVNEITASANATGLRQESQATKFSGTDPDEPTSDPGLHESYIREVEAHLTDEQIHLFQKQAEFYFNVIEDALSTLKSDPSDKNALEDLELASHSLSGLTLKLSLEPLNKIPASVEALVSRIISEELLVSQEEVKTIDSAYHYFREINRAEDTRSQKFRQLMASIEELNAANGIVQ